MGYVNDHELAKDIVQDTFVTVWEHLENFRNESAISTWVFRIASNKCLRQIEQQRRRPDIKAYADIAASTTADLEDNVRLLYKYISELPEIDRLIISLELEDIKTG